MADLDPWFIEICRRIRLTRTEGRLAARRATSAKARIAAKEFKGVTGDPWAPISAKEEKGLTLGEGDFTYRRLCDLIFSDDWLPSPLARPGPGEGASVLVAEALSRGNSKTDGFKSRVVPVPARALGLFRGPDAGHHAKAQIEEIKVFDEALRNALALVAAGGDSEKMGKPHYARATEARARFDRLADALFFPALWDRLVTTNEESRGAAAQVFLRDLLAVARLVMVESLPSVPCPTLFRPRAEARARRVFHARIGKGLGGGHDFRFLFEKETAGVVS